MFQDKDKHLSEIKSYKRQINYKNSEIETLKKQLDLSNFNGFMGKSLQNSCSKQDQKETHPIYEEFHEIVLKNEKLEKANHLLEYKVQQVEEDYEELKVEHNKTQIELRNSRENCRILETEYDKMRILKEKLEVDISEIKDEFELSLRNYQNSLVLLKSSQDIRKKLQKQLEELLEENRRLGNRAAVGFEGLTPRFNNFKKTFNLQTQILNKYLA